MGCHGRDAVDPDPDSRRVRGDALHALETPFQTEDGASGEEDVTHEAAKLGHGGVIDERHILQMDLYEVTGVVRLVECSAEVQRVEAGHRALESDVPDAIFRGPRVLYGVLEAANEQRPHTHAFIVVFEGVVQGHDQLRHETDEDAFEEAFGHGDECRDNEHDKLLTSDMGRVRPLHGLA